MKRWTFWIIGWDHGPTYKNVGTSNSKWPITLFEHKAEKGGFTKLVRDKTIIGGYFINPDSGDALVCLPYGMDPKDF